MKILIVHAHENPESFCSALALSAKKHFTQAGHEVSFSDLYSMSFNPVASKNDFTNLSGAEYYKYANEQLNASKHRFFHKDVQEEIDKLLEADIINFNFPLWWWGMPAILKGWVDRVMAYGVAYGGNYGFKQNGRFVGKQAFITTTTGSPKTAYDYTGHNDKSVHGILSLLHEGIFELLGYKVLEPFIAYGVSRINQSDREDILKEYLLRLNGISIPN